MHIFVDIFVLYFKSFRLILSSHFLIPSISIFILLVLTFFGKIPSIDSSSSFSSSLGASGFEAYSWTTNVFISFSNALPRGEYINLVCSIILLWSDGNVSSTVRNSYLSILPHDYADIIAASLLRLYYTFSSVILSSIVMISFYILFIRFFLKREELSDGRVVSTTKNEYGFPVHCLHRFIKFWKSISDEWLNAVCWSSILFRTFITE